MALHTLLPIDHLYNAERHGREHSEWWYYAGYYTRFWTHTVVCHNITVFARSESITWRNIMSWSSPSKTQKTTWTFQVVSESLLTHSHDAAHYSSHLFWKWCRSTFGRKNKLMLYTKLTRYTYLKDFSKFTKNRK
jgi:hypothetical protein